MTFQSCDLLRPVVGAMKDDDTDPMIPELCARIGLPIPDPAAPRLREPRRWNVAGRLAGIKFRKAYDRTRCTAARQCLAGSWRLTPTFNIDPQRR